MRLHLASIASGDFLFAPLIDLGRDPSPAARTELDRSRELAGVHE
jgi:hypothetical protein